MAKKTIEFRDFQNAQVPLEVVAGHLTMDLKPKHAFCTSETVDATDVGQARQGQSSTVFKNIDLDSSSLTHPVARQPHRQRTLTITKMTQLTVKWMSRVFTFMPRVHRAIWHTEFTGDLVLVTLLPVRRWKRRPVDALVRRMLHERDVAVMGSDNPDLGGRADRKTVEQLRLAQQELRHEEEEIQPERKEPAVERNIPIGQPQVKEALIRDLLHRYERRTETRSAQSTMSSPRRRLASTEEDIFMTPMGRRRWRQFLLVLGSSRGRTTRRILSRMWEPEEGDGSSKRSTTLTLN